MLGDLIAKHPSALACLPSPVYSADDLAGHLVHGRRFPKAAILRFLGNSRARRAGARNNGSKADPSLVDSAVNAIQSTPFRLTRWFSRLMGPAWDAGHPFFKLRESADSFNPNNRLKGQKKVMALVLALAEWLLDKERFDFPHQLDHRGGPIPYLNRLTLTLTIPEDLRWNSPMANRLRMRRVLARDPPCELLLEEE